MNPGMRRGRLVLEEKGGDDVTKAAFAFLGVRGGDSEHGAVEGVSGQFEKALSPLQIQ